MRMNITLVVLSLIVLLSGIVCVYMMHGSLEALSTDAALAAAALPRDALTARAALDRFTARWQRLEPLWQLFAIHEDLDSITSSLLEARTSLSSGDPQSALQACRQLLLALRTIHRKEVPSAGNIF